MAKAEAKQQMVMVKWVDSAAEGGWKTEPEGGISACESIGFLIKKDRTEVIVAQSRSDRGFVSDFIAIPRSCVKAIRVLR